MNISEKLTTIAANVQGVYNCGFAMGHSEGNHIGYENGYHDGSGDGYENGYTEGAENGKNDMINIAFNNGAKTDFDYFFARTNWDTVEFPENFVVYPKRANQMFYDYRGSKIPKIFDFYNLSHSGSYINQFCQWAKITEFPDLNIPAYEWYFETFGYCYNLKKIEIIRVMNTTEFRDAFLSCSALEDITFEGVIGTNLDMSSCKKLSVKSLRNIISCLETKTSGTFTLNIGGDNIAKLTAEDLNNITGKGWRYQ